MIISHNAYSIIEILEMLKRRELVVNADYQRGTGLWSDGPSSYFIDTILEKYPFPKIYIYESIDRESRRIRKEIVDGQQRITTIRRFAENEFALKGDTRFNGKYFRDLTEDEQISFQSYPVSVDVIRDAGRNQILQMFRRMNAYTLPLNQAEKRHSSFQGEFKWFINRVSDELDEFFVEFKVFSDRQIVRMADSEFISDLVVAVERGIVSSTPSDLNAMYKKYDDRFDNESLYGDMILSTFRFIGDEFSNLRGTYMMKSYALHSLVTALMFAKYARPNITGAISNGLFVQDLRNARANLLALSQAHEAKEVEGPFAKYVWGCDESTTKAPRRQARVMSILRAIGVVVGDSEYDAIF